MFGCFVYNTTFFLFFLFLELSDEYILNKHLTLNRKGVVLHYNEVKLTCTAITSKFIWKSWFPLQWSYNIIPLCCVSLHNSTEPISPLHQHLQLHELWISILSSQLERSPWCANYYSPGRVTSQNHNLQVSLHGPKTDNRKKTTTNKLNFKVTCFIFSSNISMTPMDTYLEALPL